MKIQILLLLAFAVFLVGCRQKPQNKIDKPDTNSKPVVHPNPLILKFIEDNIDCYRKDGIKAMKVEVAKRGHGLTSRDTTTSLYPDTLFIKNLNCTIYKAYCQAESDGTFYFIIRDNKNNQIYIRERPGWGNPFEKQFNPIEALLLLKEKFVAPIRSDLSDLESFLNRATSLKNKSLTNDMLDSLPVCTYHEKRIKTTKELDAFWENVKQRSQKEKDFSLYKGGANLIVFLKKQILSPNVLIYYSLNDGLIYIDFTPQLLYEQMGVPYLDFEGKRVKGNLYKLRVLNIFFKYQR